MTLHLSCFGCFRSPHGAMGGPGNSGMGYPLDEMEMDDQSIDIVDSIDVRQILGLNDDFLPQ